MPTPTPPTTPEKTDDEYVSEIISRFDSFREKLESDYWPNFIENERRYDGWDPRHPDKFATGSGTGIIESTINRVITAKRRTSAEVKGPDAQINRQINQALESVSDSIIDDKDLARKHGTYRSNKEVLVRDLLVIGNFVAEKLYDFEMGEDAQGRPKVKADGVYLSPCSWDQYVFNLAYTWDTSPEKGIKKFVSFESLKKNEYQEWEEDEPVIDPTTGQPTVDPVTGEPITKKVTKSRGVYTNLDKVEEIGRKTGKLRQDTQIGSEVYDGVGGETTQWVEDLEFLVWWDGCQLTNIVEGSVVVRDEYDPFRTGTSNIRTGMFIRRGKRPVGYGLMDRMRGLIQIDDDQLNQRHALLERALKIGGFLNIEDPIKARQAMRMIQEGGIVPGVDPTKWGAANVIDPAIANALLPPQELQGRLERAALYSPYSNGGTSSETDKTQGTASGIQNLQQAAEPNFEVVLMKVEETIDTPFLDFALQVIANASGDDDIRWITRAGKSNEAIGITKRFLQGRPQMDDLVLAGVMDQQQAAQWVAEHPDLQDTPYVDANWLITISLDPTTKADKYQMAASEKSLVDEAAAAGVPMNIEKAYTTIAQKMGHEDFAEYIYSQEEVDLMKAEAEKQAAKEKLAMDEQSATEHQRKLELLHASNNHEVALKGAEFDANTPEEVDTSVLAASY